MNYDLVRNAIFKTSEMETVLARAVSIPQYTKFVVRYSRSLPSKRTLRQTTAHTCSSVSHKLTLAPLDLDSFLAKRHTHG